MKTTVATMEGTFRISFGLNGMIYHARVALRFQELDVYYMVDLDLSESPEINRHLLIEMNNSGEWQQKNTGAPGWQISDEMINCIGQAIERCDQPD